MALIGEGVPAKKNGHPREWVATPEWGRLAQETP